MSYFKNLWNAILGKPSQHVTCKVIDQKGNIEWKGELEKWFVNFHYDNYEPTLTVYYTTPSGVTGIKKVKISG